MDASTTFAIAIGVACAVALAADLSVAVVRVGTAAIRDAEAPWRLIVGATVCAAMLVGSFRPAGATTPPPTVRLVDASVASAPVRDAPTRETGPPPTGTAPTTYLVEPGDSLWRIARSVLIDHGLPADGRAVARLWPIIYDLNRAVIGADPDLIHPGQQFIIPGISIDDFGGTHGA